jgi:hypothetical protein
MNVGTTSTLYPSFESTGFGLTTLGILITCDCSQTKIDAASFANPTADYYTGTIISQNSF